MMAGSVRWRRFGWKSADRLGVHSQAVLVSKSAAAAET
jgi:hypothetical protein